jgi:predicted nucleic acid-binding protein
VETCEAALSAASYLLRGKDAAPLAALMRRGAVLCSFELADDFDSILTLMDKYADVPMSLADGCLVRMSETLPTPVLLTTDSDFRIYRRHSRQAVPCVVTT